jgi:hypothetical protein
MSVKFSSIVSDLESELRLFLCFALPWSLLQPARWDAFYQKAAWLHIGLWSNTEEAAQGDVG